MTRVEAVPLLGLCAAVAGAAVLLALPGRAVAWDEAVYLARATPGVAEINWAAHRSLGLPLVLLPVTVTGAPVTVARLWLAALSAIGLFAALLPLWRSAPRLALSAALLHGTAWLALFSATEVYPNHLTGLAALATVTWAWWGLREGPATRGMAAMACAAGGLALLRPSESLLVVGAVAAGLVVAGARGRRLLPALGAGLLAGWAVWAVEAFARFGGPLQRLQAAREASRIEGELTPAFEHLVHAAGSGASAEVPVSLVGGALWWSALVLLSLAGLFAWRRRPERWLLGVGTLAALAVAAFYFLMSGWAARFLLPSYALLALPAGAGLAACGVRRGGVRLLLLAAAAVWLGWHAATALEVSSEERANRARPAALGAELAARSGGRPCAFASSSAYPQMQWRSGCDGDQLPEAADLPDNVATAVAEGRPAFVVTSGELPPESPAASWPHRAHPAGWTIYEAPRR
jgi:hypothetical protein